MAALLKEHSYNPQLFEQLMAISEQPITEEEKQQKLLAIKSGMAASQPATA